MENKKSEITKKYSEKQPMDIGDLRTIMALLRAPGGCPWDAEQTHESIRNNFIEETYEAVEAIDCGDTALLREELGDVLLQVIFHAQMEEERGSFSFDDVVDEVCRKLVLRHPHVFADTVAKTADEVLDNWDAIKKNSKNQTTATESLESVARSLPALMRAQKLIKRAGKAGYIDAAMDCGDSAGAELLRAVYGAYSAGADAEQLLYDECDALIGRVRNAETRKADRFYRTMLKPKGR